MDIGPLSGVKVVECSIWGFGPIGGLDAWATWGRT